MLTRRTLLATSAATALTACSRRAAPPGLLRVATSGMPDSLDPARGQFAAAALAYKQCQAGLTEYGVDGSLTRGLAERWESDGTGRFWRFRLREGLQWSDGAPLTAADIVWSAQRLVDPDQPFAALFDFFAVRNARAVLAREAPMSALGVTAADRLTVEFELDSPVGHFPLLMREFYPFPRQAIEQHGADWVRPAHFVTAGAYNVTAHTQLSLRMAKNPRFYDAASVAIPEIAVDAVEDAATRTRLFRSGDYDLADNPPANQIDFLRGEMGAQLRSFPAPTLTYLKLNHARPGLSDVRVRRALSLAIDRDFIAGTIFGGGARPSGTVFAFAEAAGRDLETARALMAEAGHGPDNPLSLEIRTTSGERERVAVALADNWSDIGVEATIYATYSTDLYQAVDSGDFDIALARFNRGLKADPVFMMEPFAPGGFADNYNWSDADFAAATDNARRQTDPGARIVAYRQAEARLLEEQAVIPLFHERAHWLVGARVEGVREDVQPQVWRYLSLAAPAL